jgi:hypothetical protein
VSGVQALFATVLDRRLSEAYGLPFTPEDLPGYACRVFGLAPFGAAGRVIESQRCNSRIVLAVGVWLPSVCIATHATGHGWLHHPIDAKQYRSKEHRPVADNEHHRSFAERAQQALSNVGQDDRVRQAAAVAKEAAERAEGASKTVTRKVGQEDAWDELRGDVSLLTEIARAHHALIIDLIDRVAELEGRAGIEPGAGHGS